MLNLSINTTHINQELIIIFGNMDNIRKKLCVVLQQNEKVEVIVKQLEVRESTIENT